MYPGRIVEYYPETQTADIKVCAEMVFSNTDGLQQIVERQILVGVPVLTPSGGGWSITFPIKAGDTCLVGFCDIGYDHWLYQDRDAAGLVVGQPAPQLRRCKTEDDAFAIVGFNTLPRAIQDYSANNSEWRNTNSTQVISLQEDGTITISGTGINIFGDTIINGNLHVNGEVTSTGDMVAGTISLEHHQHNETNSVTSEPI